MALISVVIGTILKPVDDVRHYHKLALSMSKTNKYEVNIIGFNSKKTPPVSDIRFFPVFNFRRLSWGRVLAPIRFLQLLIQLKPKIVIVNSPELLIVTSVYRVLSGCLFVYDVQENYYLNIRHLSPLPGSLKFPAAALVRSLELACAPLIHHFILAEKSYISLPFVGKRWTVLENRPLPPLVTPRPRTSTISPRFLLSGTLSLSYGLQESLAAYEKLRPHFNNPSLLVCGKTPDQPSAAVIHQLTKKYPEVSFLGGPEGVPHQRIVEAIIEADIGLVFYPKSPAIDSCFPTKIWEYMSYHLPMLLQDGKNWTTDCLEKKAAVLYRIGDDPKSIVEQYLQSSFYYTAAEALEVNWTDEERKLLALLQNLL